VSSFAPIGNQESISSESFWPSFTDIMMVIVMIFLFATSLLIVRNYQLVSELQDSLAAEKLAEQVIETTSLANASLEQRLDTVESQIDNATQENATLEERLTNYEQENSLLRLQVLAKKEKLKRSELKRNKLKQTIKNLNEKNQIMIASIHTQDQELQNTKASLLASNSENIQVKTDLENLQDQFEKQTQQLQNQLNNQVDIANKLIQDKTTLSKELSSLRLKQEEKNLEFEQLSAENDENQLTINLLKEERQDYNEELLTLKGEYDVVKAKYQKLIKPARSAKGKYIAEVHYIKSADKNLIRYKEPADTEYSELNLKQVESKLDRLKKKYGKDLYVKIIIPKNSGLTYNEAWSFMKGLLDKYDYYYQKQSKETSNN